MITMGEGQGGFIANECTCQKDTDRNLYLWEAIQVYEATICTHPNS